MNIRNLIILLALIALVIAGFFVFTSGQPDQYEAPDSALPDDSSDAEPAPEPGEDESPVYKDLVRIDTPLPESIVSSPLVVRGAARGGWFFEASFSVVLTDWDGRIIAEGIAQAEGDWMTTDYVPFTAELTFVSDTRVSDRGSLILRKSNASGLPEHDDAFEFTVYFAR